MTVKSNLFQSTRLLFQKSQKTIKMQKNTQYKKSHDKGIAINWGAKSIGFDNLHLMTSPSRTRSNPPADNPKADRAFQG